MEQRLAFVVVDEIVLGEPPNPIYQPKNPRKQETLLPDDVTRE